MIKICNGCDQRAYVHRRTQSDEMVWVRSKSRDVYRPESTVYCYNCRIHSWSSLPDPRWIKVMALVSKIVKEGQ